MLRPALVGVGMSLVLGMPLASVLADGSGGPAAPFSWTGFYLGTHTGGALDKSDVSNPYGPTLFGDEVRSPGPLAGIQIGYDKRYGPLVLGLEADVSRADLDGTFTCLQPAHGLPGFSPDFIGGAFGATCRSRMEWLGTLTGRMGTTVGADGRTLVYAKGGLAWGHATVDMVTNNHLAETHGPPNAESRASFTAWGWTIGAGVEYLLTGNWSARIAYDYLNLRGRDVATPDASPIANPGFPGIAGSVSPDGRTASVTQDVHAFKLGLNYRFADGTAPWSSPWPGFFDVQAPGSGPRAFEIEVGTRYVRTWSRFQQDLVVPANISRLTWDDAKTDGAEIFWRIDTPSNLMIKGVWGAGSGDGGHINDEDWGLDDDPLTAVEPYQNTVSGVDSETRYVTVDVGYNLLAGAHYKLTPFVGYNYFRQDMDARGLVYENFSPPWPELPASVVPLQQKSDWHSLRLGSAAELMLTSRLRLSADAAYLPYVRFEGLDVHPLRTDTPSFFSPQWGDGRGVQIEAVLAYDITDRFSVGAGGRYWAMWVANGKTDNFSSGEIAPQRFAAEKAALFVQGSYRFDVPAHLGP